MMLSRKEEHLVTGNRPSAYARVKAGADASGKLVAFDAETWGTGGADAGRWLLGALSGLRLPESPPAAPRRVDQRRTAARVPRAGTSAGLLRHRSRHRRNGRSSSTSIRSSCGCGICSRQTRAASTRRIANGGSTSPSARRRSAGANAIRPAMRRPGRSSAASAARQTSGPVPAIRRRALRARSSPDGSVTMRIGTQDIGTGTRTLVAMITAETMGLPLEAVQVAIGDTNYPFAPGSGGSITVGSVSPIVRVAAEAARDALFAKAAAVAWRRSQDARSQGGTHRSEGRHLEVARVARRLQAARDRADQRSRYSGRRDSRTWARAACSSPTSKWTSKRA